MNGTTKRDSAKFASARQLTQASAPVTGDDEAADEVVDSSKIFDGVVMKDGVYSSAAAECKRLMEIDDTYMAPSLILTT